MLHCVGSGAVGGGEGEGKTPGGRRAAQRAGAEGDPGGQGSRLAEGRRRGAGGGRVKVPAVPTVNVVAAADVMAGTSATVSVKSWMALGEMPLLAVKVMGKEPVAVGVPVSLPPVKVTPAGRAPASVKVGVGKPVAVGVKVLSTPSMKVVLAAEVMVGGPSTVSMKAWRALGVKPLPAVKLIGKGRSRWGCR